VCVCIVYIYRGVHNVNWKIVYTLMMGGGGSLTMWLCHLSAIIGAALMVLQWLMLFAPLVHVAR
jgi:uncharacterized membrane protein